MHYCRKFDDSVIEIKTQKKILDLERLYLYEFRSVYVKVQINFY